MKKISILLFIIIFLSACNKTQLKSEISENTTTESTETEDDGSIPRTILGCKLGETGIAHAKKILKDQGINTAEVSEDECPCLYTEDKINYMGETWAGALFQFLDNKLVIVTFMDKKEKPNCRKNIQNNFSDYYYLEEDLNVYANDDKTSICLTQYIGEYSFVQLRISDYLRNDQLPMQKEIITSPF